MLIRQAVQERPQLLTSGVHHRQLLADLDILPAQVDL